MPDSQLLNADKVHFDRHDLALTIDLILNGDEDAPFVRPTFRQFPAGNR